MKKVDIINAIKASNIPAEKKSEIIKHIKIKRVTNKKGGEKFFYIAYFKMTKYGL